MTSQNEDSGIRVIYQAMKRIFSLALMAATVFSGSAGAFACEKNLNGHQNSSDSNTEGAKK